MSNVEGSPKELVSIGIACYKYHPGIVRAVTQILSQTYSTIELIISDASSDNRIRLMLTSLLASDSRIRYYKQEQDDGLVANFRFLLQQATGEYFMWLSDDDWYESDHYVERCVQTLRNNPDVSLVTGQLKWFQGDTCIGIQPYLSFLQDSPQERMMAYYHVKHRKANYQLCGLTRRQDLLKAAPFHEINECHVLGTLAFLGKNIILEEVSYCKSREGVSKDVVTLSSSLRQKLFYVFAIAPWHQSFFLFKTVGWASSVFSSLKSTKRLGLATKITLHYFLSYMLWLMYSVIQLFTKSKIGQLIAPPLKKAIGWNTHLKKEPPATLQMHPPIPPKTEEAGNPK